MLLLGAIGFGMVICVMVLVTDDSRNSWNHRGPQPGDWELRHWVHTVLIQMMRSLYPRRLLISTDNQTLPTLPKRVNEHSQ